MTIEQGPIADPLINAITAINTSAKDIVAKYFPEYQRVKHLINKYPESITGELFAMAFRYIKSYHHETQDPHCSRLIVKLLQHQETLNAHHLEEIFVWSLDQKMDDIIAIILEKRIPLINAFSLQIFEKLIDSQHLPRLVEYLLFMTTLKNSDELGASVYRELFNYTACHGSPKLMSAFLAHCPLLNTPANRRFALARAIENGNIPMVVYFRTNKVVEDDYALTRAILRQQNIGLLRELMQPDSASSIAENMVFRAVESHLAQNLSLSDAHIMLIRVESELALLADLSLFDVTTRCQYLIDVQSEIATACKLLVRKIKEEANRGNELLRNIERILDEENWSSSRTHSLENEILTSQHDRYSPEEKVVSVAAVLPQRRDSVNSLRKAVIQDVRTQFHPRSSPNKTNSPDLTSSSTSTSNSPMPAYDDESFDAEIENAIAKLSLDEELTSPYFSGFEEMAQLVMKRPDLVAVSLFYVVFRYVKSYFAETNDRRCTQYLVAVLNSGVQYKAAELEYAFLWALKHECCDVMQAILSQRLCFIKAFPLVAFKIMIHERKLTVFLEGFLFSSIEALDEEGKVRIKNLFLYAARKGETELLRMMLNHADFLHADEEIEAAFDEAVREMNISNILFLWKHHYKHSAKWHKKHQLSQALPNVVALLDHEDNIESFYQKLLFRVGQMVVFGCVKESDLSAVFALFDAHIELMANLAALLPKEKERHYLSLGLSLIKEGKQLSAKSREYMLEEALKANDTYLPLRNSLQNKETHSVTEERTMFVSRSPSPM